MPRLTAGPEYPGEEGEALWSTENTAWIQVALEQGQTKDRAASVEP